MSMDWATKSDTNAFEVEKRYEDPLVLGVAYVNVPRHAKPRGSMIDIWRYEGEEVGESTPLPF